MGAASDIAKVESEDPSPQSFRDQGSNSWKQPIPQKRQISPTKSILKFQLEFPNSSNSTIAHAWKNRRVPCKKISVSLMKNYNYFF